MILSVSRRTDIPAFYLKWFLNRIKAGYVLVRNPMNYRQVSRIDLSPEGIDCICFWTKDPTAMLDKLDALEKYQYYFQVSINPYDKEIEKLVPAKSQIMDSFIALSKAIGRDRMIWRYDPIILSEEHSIQYHETHFEAMASRLSGYSRRCIISFLDLYAKTQRNMKGIKYHPISQDEMLMIGELFSRIARKNDLKVETCAEAVDLSGAGIEKGRCIDDRLISELLGRPLSIGKDRNQRESCGCVSSVDIGAYNTCRHSCLYCYANFSPETIIKRMQKHDENSPFLVGKQEPGDKITEREKGTGTLSR